MTNPHDLDLPIALRRTPRSCASTTAAAAPLPRPRVVSAPLPAILKTPNKPRPKKRVRFSDPGPELSRDDVADEICSTGLTPMVKRSSLGEPSAKRRRASTGEKETETTPRRTTQARARKGNTAAAAKVAAEVQRLRAELANRDAEIERLHNEALAQDTERMVELERQVETLRTELAAQQQLPALGEDEDEDLDNGYDLPSSSFYDWTLAPRDPFSDSVVEGDSSNFTAMEIVCSTPSRRRKSGAAAPSPSRAVSAPFLTPPCTSPTLPATPFSTRKAMMPPATTTPPSHVGVQAALPDPEKEALEAELVSLRLELTKLSETLDGHAAQQARLAEQLSTAPLASASPSPSPTACHDQELENRVDAVLQTLSERTAALSEVSSSLDALGFGGSTPSEVIASIAAGFRTARLELEYMTPGEITLPLTSRAAEVLDLVVSRLRELGRKGREDDEAIDEYHAIELSLRQQLGARVDAMAGQREALRERDARIAELEVGLDRLKGAAEGYRRDMGELEALVERVEGDGEATAAALRGALEDAEAQLAERGAVIGELETKLGDALAEAEELQTKMRELQMRKEVETKVRNRSYGAALALRDARVLELRREIHGINEGLRNAHEVIAKLRLENAALERRAEEAEEGTRLAREAVEAMKAELEKVAAAAAPPRRTTRSSSAAARGLATPEPQPGEFLSGDLARSGTGKRGRRRKYDSGLGLLDEDGVELGL
ncbi:hypothetical protein F4823DRAFT_150028 [Ustulina deusta]|nr:hypothetical protein F4823DRAFT_150028 [Ustulina deusta]